MQQVDSTPSVAQDATAAAWREHYASPRGYRFWPCEELVRCFAERHVGTIVEAGCGNGANLWFLAEHAAKVIGVDGCAEALVAAAAYMRQRHADARVDLRLADIFKLPLADGDADVIVDCMTSQHVPWSRHGALYAEYRRALRDGGRLILHNLGRGTTTTGASRTETFTYDKLPVLFGGLGPFCLPQGPALKSALGAAGFNPVAQRQSSRTYSDGSVTTYITTEAKAI